MGMCKKNITFCIICGKQKPNRHKYFCSRVCYWKSDLHRTTKFQIGHKGLSKDKNPAWKGGRINDGKYIKVLVGAKQYIREHRKVVEDVLGRKLRPDEDVHHIDGNKLNNDPNNLQLLSKSEHTKYHQKIKNNPNGGGGKNGNSNN